MCVCVCVMYRVRIFSSGAVRQHWKSILQRQLSEKRAEQRREAEEQRKLDEEEYNDILDDELTDEDMTDEEEEEEEEEESNAVEYYGDSSSDVLNNSTKVADAGARDMDDEEEEEEEELANPEQCPDDDDDDDDDVVVHPLVSRSYKPRIIDSDDESDTSSNVSTRHHVSASSTTNVEASSTTDDCHSNSRSHSATPLPCSMFQAADIPAHETTPHSDGVTPSFKNLSEHTGPLPVPPDSGMGPSLDDSQLTQLVEEEEEVGVADTSFQLVQSLVPAQRMRREFTDDLITPAVTRQNSIVSSRSDRVSVVCVYWC